MATNFASRSILFSHSTKLFILPFKPPSSHLSCSLPLRFTRTICTLQHLQHKQPQTSRTVIGILEERGLLDSITNDALRSISSNTINAPLKVYCGFDPTAESLHLGNLLGLIVLSWFRRSGHNVVAVIGGATARVGDPSGKSLERPELDVETLERNTAGIENTIRTILGRAKNPNFEDSNVNGNDSSVVVLNNYDWWKEFSFLDFLKRVGKYARVGSMMAKESVKKRMRVEGATATYGLTFPLLLKSDDDDVIRFLKVLTFLDIDEIIKLEEETKKPGYVPNTAQRRLAEEVTRFVHGEDGLREARRATEALKPGSETKLDWKTIEGIAEDVPSCSLAYDEVLNQSLVDLSVSSGLFDSKSAARRLLKQGGLYLNNSRVDSENKRIEEADIVDGKVLLLSAGKKNKVLVRIA
ncbi:unnamed protein product [Vicia faba]|uniref:Tyrosine--tRNA ligase n=1 Tax=Vicia faba TaxID=3906 RepID=A0AAV0ZHC1_VICFA|nr:unnamed protein product [Vicia faba]